MKRIIYLCKVVFLFTFTSINPRLYIKSMGVTVLVGMSQITNERRLHASLGETFDVARGPDVTSLHIISSDSLTSHLGLPPNISRHWSRSRTESRSTIWTRRRNNVADDRVGQFTSLRLGLRCRSEETGRARKSESGGRVTVFMIVRFIRASRLNNIFCDDGPRLWVDLLLWPSVRRCILFLKIPAHARGLLLGKSPSVQSCTQLST